MNLHGISFGTPQAIFHLGRLKFKSVPPPWGLKMDFYAPLEYVKKGIVQEDLEWGKQYT